MTASATVSVRKLLASARVQMASSGRVATHSHVKISAVGMESATGLRASVYASTVSVAMIAPRDHVLTVVEAKENVMTKQENVNAMWELLGLTAQSENVHQNVKCRMGNVTS